MQVKVIKILIINVIDKLLHQKIFHLLSLKNMFIINLSLIMIEIYNFQIIRIKIIFYQRKVHRYLRQM